MNINWVGTISEEIEDNPGMSFSKQRLENQPDLFAHRSALYFTPTENIPTEYVGSGALNITLPIPTPDYTDYRELNSYRSPKLWVDLIQRQANNPHLVHFKLFAQQRKQLGPNLRMLNRGKRFFAKGRSIAEL